MKPPIFVRTLSKDERERLEASLRSKDAFTLRRSQMLLASSRGDEVPQIARSLGCGQQTVRDAIHDFNERGLDALVAGSSRPQRTQATFDEKSAEALRELLHRSPREFGHDRVASGRLRWRHRLVSSKAWSRSEFAGRPSGQRLHAFSECA